MAKFETVIDHLNGLLRIAEVPDYPGALNGLQLNRAPGPVRKVAAAVDACLPVIREAVEQDVDLLVVHHGLFWQGAQRIDGALFEKLKLAMDHGLAIYSCHIPLDIHETYGNNALLAKAIGLRAPKPFFLWKGIQLGLMAPSPGTLDALAKKVEKAVGAPVHVCAGGGSKAGKVGVITGGAGSEVMAIAEEGIDTFITGEGPHWSYTAAEELGLNVIYAGHYATETFGARAIATHLASKFKLQKSYIDHPTGL